MRDNVDVQELQVMYSLINHIWFDTWMDKGGDGLKYIKNGRNLCLNNKKSLHINEGFDDTIFYSEVSDLPYFVLYDFYLNKKGIGQSMVFEMLVYPYLKKDFDCYPRYRLDFKAKQSNVYIEAKMDGVYVSGKQKRFIRLLLFDGNIDELFIVSGVRKDKSCVELIKIYNIPIFVKAYLYRVVDLDEFLGEVN